MRSLTPDRSPVIFRAYVRILRGLAVLWRPFLFRTHFVAITGSLGKTVAKQCLVGILSERFSVGQTFASQSANHGVPLSILRIRPWHDFAVMETGAPRPGTMARSIPLVRPGVALVLTVVQNHSDHYSGLNHIATEKRRLVESLPRDGLAVLNADVEYVRDMARQAPCRVFTFGRTPGSDLFIDNIDGAWPERLRFRATHGQETVDVRTRLVGRHQWTPAAGALAVAVNLGVNLTGAAAALSRAVPHTARLEPVRLPGGAMMLRDELGAVPDSFDGAMEVLAGAKQVRRRIAVLGQLSDSGMKGGDCADLVAARAARSCDVAVFVGRYAKRSARVAMESGMKPDCVHGFKRLEDAAEFLHRDLREGDLVLLKGRVTEHLARIYHAQLGTVQCWTRHCRLTLLCDYCSALGFKPFR